MTATVRPLPLAGVSSPYVGLMPFSVEDQRYFFGREQDVELIVANVHAYPLTLLYGPSGVGKSSVLGAGVVPSLREPDDDRPAMVVDMRSWRDDPSATIDALLGAEAAAAGFEARPPDPDLPLLGRLRHWAEHTEADVVCVLDQFEDYFLYHPDPTERFGVELARALAAAEHQLHFLISLREDALGKLDRFQPFVPNLFDNYYRLEPLTTEQARAAVTRPLQRYNEDHPDEPPVSIEPDLVERVLAEVRSGEVVVGLAGEGRVDAWASDEIETSHLQLVLTRLWGEERRHGSASLRLTTFEQLGGAVAIVSSHLSDSLDRFDGQDRALAAELFRYLVTPSGTKIAHSLSDLAGYTGESAGRLAPVVERLASGEVRILRGVPPAPGRPATDPRYEIFHDALGPAILDWRRQREKEIDLAAADAEVARTRARYRRRLAVIVGIGLLLACLAATSIALLVQGNAAARVQRSRQLAAEAMARLDADPTDAARLGLAAWDESHTTEAEDAVRQAASRLLVDRALVGHIGAVTGVDVTADGALGLTTSDDGTARLWNLALGETIHVLSGHGAAVRGGAFSPDASTLATWSDDGTVRIWDAATGEQRGVVDGYNGMTHGVVYSPDSAYLAVTVNGDAVRIVSAATGVADRTIPTENGQMVVALAFDPANADVLFTGHFDGRVRAWSNAGGQQLAGIETGSDHYISALAVSGDGATVIAGNSNGELFPWRWQEAAPEGPVTTDLFVRYGQDITDIEIVQDGTRFVASGEKVTSLFVRPDRTWLYFDSLEHVDWAQATALSEANGFFVSVSRDGSGSAGSLLTGDRLAELKGHAGGINDVAVAADGTILTGSSDGTGRVWTLPNVDSLVGHTYWVLGASVASRSGDLASAGGDGRLIVWNPSTRTATLTVDRVAGDAQFDTSLPSLESVAIDPDGRYVAASDGASETWVWDTQGSPDTPVARLGSGGSLAMEPGGDLRLAVGQMNGTLVVWDWRHPGTLSPSLVTAHGFAMVSWSNDGRIAAGLGDGSAMVWDAATLDPLATLRGHVGQVWNVTFSPDGTLLATAGEDRTAAIWNLATGLEQARLVGHGTRLSALAFTADGSTLVTGDAEGVVGYWNVSGGQLLSLAQVNGDSINDLVTLSDGTTITASDDNALRVTSCTACQPIEELVASLRERLEQVPKIAPSSDPGFIPTNMLGHGQCLAELPVERPAGDPVDCGEPHGTEVFATFSFTDERSAPYPGIDELAQRAQPLCESALPDYVGADATSAFDVVALVPVESAWGSGLRAATCYLEPADGGTLTGSARRPPGRD